VGLLSWIVVGLVAGWIAGRITHQRMGCAAQTAIGVLGALIGGALARAAGLGAINNFGLRTLLVAALGATLLLAVLGSIAARPRR
jgi:uncharacterized membrane protein YeaQ/YmgE (transglycosylase-associated protein family)